jgi:hypothetical protein
MAIFVPIASIEQAQAFFIQLPIHDHQANVVMMAR